MYQVYSLQHPGRPRWALAACILLLLLTVGLAAALIAKRAHLHDVELNESRIYPAGRVRARLPAGWEPVPPRDQIAGVVTGLAEPSRPAGPGRSIFLFRGPPEPTGLPSTQGASTTVQMARALAGGQELGRSPIGPDPVGGLPGWTVGRLSLTLFHGGAVPTYCLGRAAIAPGGEVVGVILVLPGQQRPRRADVTLLDEVSRQLELLDAGVDAPPADVMSAAGIQFKPPADVRFVAPADPALPRVRLMAGQGPTCWFLDVHRVPLIGSRTPEHLVEDYALSLLRQAAVDRPIETTQIAGRQVAHVMLSIPPGSAPSSYVLATSTDEHTALLMIGRHETDAGPTLRDACRSILESAVVSPYDELIDTGQARRTARQWLDLIAEERLSAGWARYEKRGQVYVRRSPAIDGGYEVRTYEQYRKDDFDWWAVAAKTELRLARTTLWKLQEDWHIRDDAGQYELSLRRSAHGRTEIQYHEQQRGEAAEVERELGVLSNGTIGKRSERVLVDDGFGCEPVLLRAGAHIARDPQRRPAIFTALERFPPRPVYWIMVPIGQAELPGGASIGSARAVRLQRDYDPSPITLYYDQSDTLVRAGFDDGRWRELTGEAGRNPP